MAEAATAIATAQASTNPTDAELVLNRYLYLDSWISVMAMNALIGQTDDWRLRHNFFL